MAWKTLSSKEEFRCPWLHVTEDKVKTDGGKLLTWNVVHMGPFALVIPFDGEKFVMVRLYRYPVKHWSWEFPAGRVDEKSPLAAAKRELEEEAGLKASKIKSLGSFHTANGTLTQTCNVFLATDLKPGKRNLDGGEEGMTIKRFSYAQVCKMINAGTITDGPSIAAFTYLHTSGWIQKHL